MYFIRILLLIFFASCWIHHSAQGIQGIKVKKAVPISREFVYNGKPVAPEALVDLFPDMAEGNGKDTADLRKFPYDAHSYKDSSKFFHPWIKDYQTDRIYWSKFTRDYFGAISNEVAEYMVMGNTSGGKFIILGSYNGGGTLTITNVFILDIQGDKLIKLGGFLETYDTKRYPVEIRGDTIINGSITYQIPLSAR
jgi:hypothetical protein